MEIIIAMTIIAILSGALLANFFTSLSKGRDSRRKQDLDLYAKSLEIYYNDHKAYPTGNEAPGQPLTDGTSIYMQKTPTDPKQGDNWLYDYDHIGATGAGYVLFACLENANDPDRHVGGYPQSNPLCSFCNTEGSASRCNYAISSPNITPIP